MIKILGILLLIISGSVGGCSASALLSERVRFTEEFMEFIQIIENEIRYTGRCLSEIISERASDTPFYSYLSICNQFIEKGCPFPDAWDKTFLNLKKEMGITYEFSQIVYKFGTSLGAGDIESQIAYCKHNYKLTEPYLKQAMEEKSRKGRIYSILGTCLGIAVSLVFI